MSGIKISIINNSKLIEDELETAIKKALMLCGEAAKGYAKKICPVDTGNLRNSIDYEVNENTMQVGTNVEYAEAVECGYGQKAQPYLAPSIKNHEDKYRNIIKSALSG